MALERDRDNLGTVQKVLADGGYTGKAFASSVQELIGAEVEIAKRNEGGVLKCMLVNDGQTKSNGDTVY